MAQLAVGGFEIQVDDERLLSLRDEGWTAGQQAGGSRALEIRSPWSATTDDYEPVLVLELPGGVLVTRCGSQGEPTDVVVCGSWRQIEAVVAEERAWSMVLALRAGREVRLRFGSLAELRQVMARVEGPHGSDRIASQADPAGGQPESEGATHPRAVRMLRATHPTRTHAHAGRRCYVR